MSRAIIGILVLFPFLAVASQPRLDLYNKIKKETGVSLKEAFQAVDKGSRTAILDLQLYAKRVGISEIKKSFQEEIIDRQNYCKKKKGATCPETVEDLKSQIAAIQEMFQKFDKLDSAKKLYLSLLIYNFRIKSKVLIDAFREWDQNCNTQSKINSKPCQKSLFESHTLTDIASDLGQVALQKSEKIETNQELIKSIKDRILRYDKL